MAVHTHFADIAIARDQADLGMDKISDIGEGEALHSGPENREGLVTQRLRYETGKTTLQTLLDNSFQTDCFSNSGPDPGELTNFPFGSKTIESP